MKGQEGFRSEIFYRSHSNLKIIIARSIELSSLSSLVRFLLDSRRNDLENHVKSWDLGNLINILKAMYDPVNIWIIQNGDLYENGRSSLGLDGLNKDSFDVSKW